MEEFYVGSREEFVGVADVIREKAKTSELLVWPDGYKTAIRAASDLNFEVIGGVQPSNPKENTIWIDTDQEIAGWMFSAEKPTTPYEGMVWLEILHVGTGFNAISENSIYLKLTATFQYISGAWENKPAKIYQNGEWITIWNRVLFDNGDQFYAITGGWEPKPLAYAWSSNASFSNPTIGTTLAGASPSNGSCVVGTRSKINFSGATLLSVEVVTNNPSGLGISLNEKDSGSVYTSGAYVAGTWVSNTGVIHLPVDEVDGEYYVIFSNNNDRKFAIKKVWITKEAL